MLVLLATIGFVLVNMVGCSVGGKVIYGNMQALDLEYVKMRMIYLSLIGGKEWLCASERARIAFVGL
ncbi:hypothetical protein [Xanthomonas sp. 3307]|uniref:hypothetical protein n=1 Tax=Xanthomonas sp. 3307 TaxID=3035316 RepID=UPI001613A525|nr:hypothetical protein [Xanthomonas sp. 3307]MBB5944499.1 hypothetical protein [Xanthomonas sp. 3307]